MRSCLLLALVLPGVAGAAPSSIAQSGRLLDGVGTPMQGAHSVTFAVYGAADDTSALWSETDALNLADGYYSTVLGDGQAFPASLWMGEVRWLGVSVDGEELLPRQPIHATPSAFHAATADNATGDLTPSSVDVSGTLRARQGVLLEAAGPCPSEVVEGTLQYADGSVQVCTASGWTALSTGLQCPTGWWRVNDGKLCVQQTLQAAGTAHEAIKNCRDNYGARVCRHDDLQLACGYGINPYAGSAIGWYGDHGYSVDIDVATSGNQAGNTDDEYLTWNRAVCDTSANNDGPAYQTVGPSGEDLPYRCCR